MESLALSLVLAAHLAGTAEGAVALTNTVTGKTARDPATHMPATKVIEGRILKFYYRVEKALPLDTHLAFRWAPVSPCLSPVIITRPSVRLGMDEVLSHLMECRGEWKLEVLLENTTTGSTTRLLESKVEWVVP